jgi:hypothetical protein
MYRNTEQEKERQKREKEALAEHARMSKLFQEDPAAFEMERRRLIVDAIAQCKDSQRKILLEESQKSFDRIMKGAGSSANRFNMAEALLWSQVINKFMPALQELRDMPTSFHKKTEMHKTQRLRLCK